MKWVERVALALTRTSRGFENAKVPLELSRMWVRIVIAAMRKPTADMMDAANEAVWKTGEPPAQADVVWEAMIDAALAP